MMSPSLVADTPEGSAHCTVNDSDLCRIHHQDTSHDSGMGLQQTDSLALFMECSVMTPPCDTGDLHGSTPLATVCGATGAAAGHVELDDAVSLDSAFHMPSCKITASSEAAAFDHELDHATPPAPPQQAPASPVATQTAAKNRRELAMEKIKCLSLSEEVVPLAVVAPNISEELPPDTPKLQSGTPTTVPLQQQAVPGSSLRGSPHGTSSKPSSKYTGA